MCKSNRNEHLRDTSIENLAERKGNKHDIASLISVIYLN